MLNLATSAYCILGFFEVQRTASFLSKVVFLYRGLGWISIYLGWTERCSIFGVDGEDFSIWDGLRRFLYWGGFYIWGGCEGPGGQGHLCRGYRNDTRCHCPHPLYRCVGNLGLVEASLYYWHCAISCVNRGFLYIWGGWRELLYLEQEDEGLNSS